MKPAFFTKYAFHLLYPVVYIGFLLQDKQWYSRNNDWLTYLPTFITHLALLMAYLTLKNLEEQLPQGMFLKVHRSFLVNFSKIEKIEDNHIIAGGKPIPISRSYHDNVARMIDKHLLKR